MARERECSGDSQGPVKETSFFFDSWNWSNFTTVGMVCTGWGHPPHKTRHSVSSRHDLSLTFCFLCNVPCAVLDLCLFCKGCWFPLWWEHDVDGTGSANNWATPMGGSGLEEGKGQSLECVRCVLHMLANRRDFCEAHGSLVHSPPEPATPVSFPFLHTSPHSYIFFSQCSLTHPSINNI